MVNPAAISKYDLFLRIVHFSLGGIPGSDGREAVADFSARTSTRS